MFTLSQSRYERTRLWKSHIQITTTNAHDHDNNETNCRNVSDYDNDNDDDSIMLTILITTIIKKIMHHVKCLASLYNKARATRAMVDDQDDIIHGIALAELVSYIDDACMEALVAPVFKLVDLTRLYTTRLEQLGTKVTGRVHSTKLKDRIMIYFPDMVEHKSGRDVLLAFKQDVGSALHKACEQDADSEGVSLARAANIVRRDMLNMKMAFSGSFEPHCQEQSVPTSLVALVAMILYGPNIQEQSDHSIVSTPTLTISQLLMFNSYARRRQSTSHSESTKHNNINNKNN